MLGNRLRENLPAPRYKFSGVSEDAINSVIRHGLGLGHERRMFLGCKAWRRLLVAVVTD
jgi:hypothetical protein